MSRKTPGTAKRAKKKHQKALKRSQKLDLRHESRERQARREPARSHDPLEDWAPQEEGIHGLALRLETPHFVAARLADRLELPPEVWAPKRVSALSTEELVRKLGEMGIAVTQAGFQEAFTQIQDESVSAAAERLWMPSLSLEATVHDQDFVLLAARELFGRWLPGQSSHEALVCTFLDSLDAHDDREDERAVEHGLNLWHMLRPRLSEQMRLPEDVDALFDIRETFSLWPLDFASSSLTVAARRPELAAPAAQVIEGVVAQFSEEADDWRLSLESDRARLLATAGRHDEAEQLLLRLIDRHPHAAAGYVVLAELLSRPGADAASRQRALELLEAAAARPVEDGEDWSLNRRIRELRKDLAQTPR